MANGSPLLPRFGMHFALSLQTSNFAIGGVCDDSLSALAMGGACRKSVKK